jgi:hypothetical protein
LGYYTCPSSFWGEPGFYKEKEALIFSIFMAT